MAAANWKLFEADKWLARLILAIKEGYTLKKVERVASHRDLPYMLHP